MSSMPTLEELRREARRVFGIEFIDLSPYPDDLRILTLTLAPRRHLDFRGRSKAAARRFALETLRSMPSKESST